MNDGRTLTALPIWAPADPAIPVPEIPAQAVSTKPFVLEVTILQRERDPGVPAWLFTAGGIVVLVFTLTVITALTWGAGRIKRRTLRRRSRRSTRWTALPRGRHDSGITFRYQCSSRPLRRCWSAAWWGAGVRRTRLRRATSPSMSPSQKDR